MKIPDFIARSDLAVLDRAYTPAAHLAHDALGLSPANLSRICTFCTVGVIGLGDAPLSGKAILFASTTFLFWSRARRISPPKDGMANPLRYTEQMSRIFVAAILLICLPDWLLTAVIFLVMSVLYFAAVQEPPPRQRAPVAQPASQPTI